MLIKNYREADIVKAIGELTWETRFFPDISDIVKKIDPQMSDDDKAKELAGAIVEAISRFGYCNESEAMAFIGDLGQLIVDRCGGWDVICKTKLSDLGTLRAQIRDTAKATMISAKALPSDNMLPYQKETKKVGGKLEKLDFNN